MSAFADYCDRELIRGVSWSVLRKVAVQLYHGLPGAKNFRRTLSESPSLSNVTIHLICRWTWYLFLIFAVDEFCEKHINRE